MNFARFGLVSLFLLAGAFWIGAQAPSTPPKNAEPAKPAAEPSPEDQKDAAIVKRFAQVLEANPRRGTALDRIYGYHVERGSLQGLIDEYAGRTKKDEKDGVAWMIIGLLESQRGKDASAVAAFQQAESRLTTNAMPGYYLGQALILVGKPDAAAEAFERAITRQPNRTDLLDIFQALGRVYQRAQKADKALDVWNRMEKLFPDDPRVQDQIATTLVEEGQFDQALPRVEKLAAKTEDPYRKATLLMDAAELKIKLKRSPQALADLEKLLGELNPDSWLYRDVRRRIEDVFVRSDDLAGLSKYYEAWIEKNPNDLEAIARLARNLSTQGRLPEARTWLEKGIAAAPTKKELRQALIDQLSFEQKFAEALPHYEALDKSDPNNPDILREWGKLVMRDAARPESERQAAATAIWKRLLEKKPKDPVVVSQVADLIRSAGLAEEAIALYKRAVELAPNAAQYREYLGEYLQSLKRFDEALATWRPIAEGANRNAKNLARLAEVFAGFGYRKEAIAALADAIALDQSDFNLYVSYADQLHQNEQHDEALKQLDNAARLISNAEDSEAVLLAQLKIYQETETLEARINDLQKELDAKQNPTAERWHRLARFYDVNRQAAEAMKSIARAAELDPKSIPILTSAARIHEASGNLLRAAETNRQLANLDRRFRTEYLTNVAKLEAKLGRREQALQAGRDLLAAAPGNPDHYKFFADLCFQLGDSEEGLEALRRSVRANPSEPQGLLTLAQALNERQRTGEAIELLWRAFDKTTELDGRLGVVATLAEHYLQMNQFDRLLERLERERREAEKAREMTLCIAAAYQAAGDLGTARQQLERLLTENTRDTALLAQLSQLSEAEGDINSAVKFQRLVDKAAPNNQDAQLRLAQLLVRLGEASEAAEIWVKMVANETEPHRNLQSIDQLRTAGKTEAVLAILARMLAQKPGDWELLYREGATLAQLNRRADAAKRFQAILALKLADDEKGAAVKAAEKSKSKDVKKGQGQAYVGRRRRMGLTTDQAPLIVRMENLYELLGITGIDPRYAGYAGRGGAWAPRDYGQARVAAIAWLHAFALGDNTNDEFMRRYRTAKEQAGADSRARWDWYYLQSLRMNYKEVFQVASELAKHNDPAGHLAYLQAASQRTVERRQYYYRGGGKEDRTPPLPNDQLDQLLVSYRKLQQVKPDWLTSEVVQNVLTELKRAKRPEEKDLYQEAVAKAGTLAQAPEALQLAATRGDPATFLALFAKLEHLQGPPKPGASAQQMPTRQFIPTFAMIMADRRKQKAYDDVIALLDTYLAHVRKQNQVLLKSPTNKPATANNVRYGPYGRVVDEFPKPNDYFDAGSITLLRNAYEAFKDADLLSDLLTHVQKQLATGPAAEKVYHYLALGYIYAWSGEKEESLQQMTLASREAPGDFLLLLEVAELHEKNNGHLEALALLDSIAPFDQQIMQRREEAALRLAERTGNVARAREAAERLFGLRLDAEKQVELAGKMHRLGMHEMAETVLGRAQRQAGGRNEALVSLMNQYQSQGQGDQAIQIARQLLRKAPSLNFDMYGRRQDDDANARSQAIQIIARSGKLKEMIERAETQLKSSPKSLPIQQTLLDYYRAAGEKAKIKETILKMVELKPDDGKFRFAMAMQLNQAREPAAAMEQFKIAIKLEPASFAYRYWEVIQLFAQQNKQDELAKLLDEIDVRKMRNYWTVLEIIQPLLRDEKTQEHGMQLFRKVWEAFPEERAQMMSYLADRNLAKLPEIFTYARQAVLPLADTTPGPWHGAEEISYYGEGPMGALNKLFELARQQNRVEPLRKEVAEIVRQKPEWRAGRAMLAIMDLQMGRVDPARKAWAELLDDKRNAIPPLVRVVLANELEHFSVVEDLYVRTLEEGVNDILEERDFEFGDGPIRKLARHYRKTGRKEEARALIMRSLKRRNDPWNQEYEAYQSVQNAIGVAQFFMQEEEPVEAVRILNDLLVDKEVLSLAAMIGGGDSPEQQVEMVLAQAIKATKTGNLAASLRSLLEPRPLTAGNKDVLDLVLLVDSRDLAKAKATSMLAKALEEAAKRPETTAEAVKQLDSLVTKHPRDFSVQIAAALAAFAENKPERIDTVLQALVKLVESAPLEPLTGKARANARQRAEAAKQLGLWAAARLGLKSVKWHAAGAQLGARAVMAAKRQLDPLQAQAMLREWGEIETERGDAVAAEARFTELLKMILPGAAPKTPGAETGGGAAPAAPPAPRTRSDGPAEGGPAARAAIAVTTLLQPVPPAAAAPSSGAALNTDEQFRRALDIAKIAANKKLLDFSLRAVTEALRGGPPIPVPNDSRRPRRFIYSSSGQMVPDDSGASVDAEGLVRDMVDLWRKHKVPAADIYRVLQVAVLPDARPAEVFLYRGAIRGDLSRKSLGATLIETAVEAKRVEDLRERLRKRLDQPLGELNARALLAELALHNKDHAQALQLIDDFGARLRKDTLQTTANLIAATLLPALKDETLAAAARAVLQAAAKNLAGNNGRQQAQNLLYHLLEHDLDKKDEATARATIKEIEELGKRESSRQGDGIRMQQAQRLAQIFLHFGWSTEALEQLGYYVDAQLTRSADKPTHNEITLPQMALLTQTLSRQPAARRFELLKAWTFPTSAKALRFASGQLPSEAPPPAFGSYAWPAGAVVSTGTMLLAAAKETGKLDELAQQLDKLVVEKVENAATLRILARLFQDQHAAIEPMLRERLKEVHQRADMKPARGPQRYYVPDDDDEDGRLRPTINSSDFLIAQLCTTNPATWPIANEMLQTILRHSQAIHDLSMGGQVRRELLRLEARRRKLADFQPTTGLTKWSSIGRDSLWTAQDGVVHHLVSAAEGVLLFDYPLTGTFEFSVDGYQGGWGEGHAGYGGIVFEPNRPGVGSRIFCVGQYDQVHRLVQGIRNDAFNRLTIQSASGKVRYLLNGELVYEDTSPSPTSPWLMLWSGVGRASSFRNVTLAGSPMVPKEVKLTDGSALEGWLPRYFDSNLPARMVKNEPKGAGPQNGVRYRRRGPVDDEDIEEPEPVHDWEAKDGELVGRDQPAATPLSVPSLLSYFRPLKAGETIRYEFMYKPGEFHVHPALGRLAFLFEPDGVKMRWLLDHGADWRGLKSDNTLDEPASRQGPSPLPLKADAFNSVRLAIGDGDVLTIELNGTLIFKRRLEKEVERTFGLFHYQDQSAVRVRNVVLTGKWPEKLASLDDASFAGAGAASAEEARLRRALIGERGLGQDEEAVLKQARALPAGERYALLAEWVLPSEARPSFKLSGTHVPLDVLNRAPRGPAPEGRRLLFGSEFSAPVIELLAAAKETNQLDDLAQRVEQDKRAAAGPLTQRCKLALSAAIRSLQQRDEDARAALQKLLPLAKNVALDAGTKQRWPDLIACLYTMHRPALQRETLALLDAMNDNVNRGGPQQKVFPDRMDWLRIIRHARAQAQVLALPEPLRQPFGADPRLQLWSPVVGVHDWTRGEGLRIPHWTVQDGTIRHYPGHEDDMFYLNVPLRGDFEVTCELAATGWREMRCAYGALRCDVMHTKKEYQIHVLGEGMSKFKVEPPLPDLAAGFRYRLVVQDGAYTTYVNDRKLAEEYVGSAPDPWLFLQASHLNTAEARNLKILGAPTVPESIDLLRLGFDMRGWRGYNQSGAWLRRGGEIHDAGAPPKRAPGEVVPPRSLAAERTLFYHRPMLEDGVFEYEFYYEKDVALVHPAFDRLAFILAPEGVKLHWITDGPHERSGVKVDNLSDEPMNRRGGALPLNDKAWNTMRLTLRGDALTLHLNGQAIYERAVEATNQRFFGFFHYADATEARIRKASYRGNWPKQLPKADELFLRK
jgi:tetratricopeptide (TPR) repeat protein